MLREAEAAGLDEDVNDLDGGDVIAENDAMEAERGEAVDQTAANFTQVCMRLKKRRFLIP